MVDDTPSDRLATGEVTRRLAVLEHNIRELRSAARTLARDRGADGAAFEELDRALEEAEAALPESSEPGADEAYRSYRTVLHRLQDVRGSFDREVDAVDGAVEGRLRSWERDRERRRE